MASLEHPNRSAVASQRRRLPPKCHAQPISTAQQCVRESPDNIAVHGPYLDNSTLVTSRYPFGHWVEPALEAAGLPVVARGEGLSWPADR